MRRIVIPGLLLLAASPGVGQIGLPTSAGQDVIGQTVDGAMGRVRGTLDRTRDIDALAPVRSAARLAEDRLARLTAFAREHSDTVELDDQGEPARRGVVLLVDPDPAALKVAERLGFVGHPVEDLGALDLAPVELAVPKRTSLRQALDLLRKTLPGKTLTGDTLNFQSGAAAGGGAATTGPLAAIGVPVGMIDGGVGPSIAIAKARGFVPGSPAPSDHGTAIAALLRYAGVRQVFAADIYGRAGEGGNALAIARALGWMAEEKVPVVSISLIGPRNPLLERAIAALIGRGTGIVAAVGNDGPAAPPAYPASYPEVIAVTGVDGRDRALIEAARALHLDYAAPGADMRAPDANGRPQRLRGTSYAAPLVAARVAAAMEAGKPVRATLDREARDLGTPGPDASFGRGLLCGACRPR